MSGAASLRNAVKRKTHKERSQPADRRKHGLLEKKGDYLKRARDYHRKENAIKALREKAAMRNEDEFNFGMVNSRTKDGVHQVETAQANKYTQGELRLMKTQDVGYVTTARLAEKKRLERLQSQLHMLGGAKGDAKGKPKNKHTLFVETEEEADAFDAAKALDTPAELLGRRFNRPRNAQLANASLVVGGAAVAADPKARKETERRRAAAYRELAEAAEREDKLRRTAEQMVYQKELMGGGRKRKLRAKELAPGTGAKANVHKWKRERKK
uniref:U3 small nucleolar RNA-associated protein 11 n=1 Tax=Prasinoderma coloniale TaxID=156133 RepID=A0A7R9TM75_9VIRI|mmetsp:Transcript_3250/g.13175  ORF Transcript_3250/g.13175 Transcript_3250/m.13175 type:complete len:270 (+) Transcript_3250:179-988(+)|eukprot:PRCOL_00003072-RA